MAMEPINAASHATHAAPRAQNRPASPTAPTPRQMQGDRFESSRPASTQPVASAGSDSLMGVANLGRLPHLFHLLAPVGNLVKGTSAKVASHLHHGMEAAKVAGGGFVARLGGPLSVVATGLSAVVAVLDIRNAAKVLQDPKASSHEKRLTVTQATLSGASGLTGLLAAAGAMGLALPFSIPVLLGVSTVTGLASFAVSLFNRHSGH